jgi:hypothetical protein
MSNNPMTDDDRLEMLASLVRSRALLLDVELMCERVAEACKDADAKGLAFSLLMVKESISAYSKELARYVETAVDE